MNEFLRAMGIVTSCIALFAIIRIVWWLFATDHKLVRASMLATSALLLTAPLRAQMVTEYEPPSEYKVWYDSVLSCSGVVTPRLPFETLYFIAVDAERFQARDRMFIGYTFLSDSTIAVIKDSVGSARVLSHEFMHAITGRPNHGPMFETCSLMDDGFGGHTWPRSAEDST